MAHVQGMMRWPGFMVYLARNTKKQFLERVKLLRKKGGQDGAGAGAGAGSGVLVAGEQWRQLQIYLEHAQLMSTIWISQPRSKIQDPILVL